LDPFGYELCTPEGGKGGGVRATRGFEIGETVMIGELEGEVGRKADYEGSVGPYLLEIDLEPAAAPA
jgi:hypothetical protein